MKGYIMNKKSKIIFHIDLNAFYASVEMILDPNLKTKVFAVGGGLNFSRGGVLTTASYKARKYGINSGMSVFEAYQRYPNLIVVTNKRKEYQKYSKIFMETLKQFTNHILQASIDEAYLDVTNVIGLKTPEEFAKEIQDTLLEKQLPSSIGIGPTLFLAKMASDLKKPLGITTLNKENIKTILYHLDVGEVHGIGTKTRERLNDINVFTISDFMNINNKDKIIEAIGINAYVSRRDDLLGNSTDFVDVYKYEIPKSISNENTLSFDMDNRDLLKEELDQLFLKTHQRLVNEKLLCRSVFVKLRNNKFETKTKTQSLLKETDDYLTLFEMMGDLFDELFTEEPIRLIGVGFSNIIHLDELKIDRTIFNYKELDKKK